MTIHITENYCCCHRYTKPRATETLILFVTRIFTFQLLPSQVTTTDHQPLSHPAYSLHKSKLSLPCLSNFVSKLLIYSFLILSFLVTPIENLSIFNSTTSSSSTSSIFVKTTVSKPCIIAGICNRTLVLAQATFYDMFTALFTIHTSRSYV